MSTRAAPADRLVDWRREFPGVEASLFFISHSLGAMPRDVEASLREYALAWRDRSIRAWEERWFALPAEIGDTLGHIFNAEKGAVSVHLNVTLAQAVALSAVDFTPPRNRLVCTEEDFPSVLYLYEGLKRRGAEIVKVAAQGGHRIDEQAIVAAIDERTAVVAISHVLFRTSQVLDLAPITQRARAAGALTLIDAYQSIGTVPVDVQALGIDLLTGGSVKWLCGGPGVGYLYAAPRVAARLEPALTGWMGHERPFDFDPGPMRWHGGERRFMNGTPAIPALLSARPGFEIVSEIGVPAIRQKSVRQTERLMALADEAKFRVVSPREASQRGGTVVIDVPRADQVCQKLLAADVLLDHRPGVGLRLAPHFYTRDEELDVVIKRIKEEAARLR